RHQRGSAQRDRRATPRAAPGPLVESFDSLTTRVACRTLVGGVQALDRREVLWDRRTEERRTRASVQALESDQRSGHDRRVGERRVVLPPLSRLVPALIVVAATLADLSVGQAPG